MPKAYLRYEESSVFGVITSPASNVTFDCTGKLAVVGALESCLAWKVRGGEAVHRCRAPLLTHGQGGRTVNEMAAVTRAGGNFNPLNWKRCILVHSTLYEWNRHRPMIAACRRG